MIKKADVFLFLIILVIGLGLSFLAVSGQVAGDTVVVSLNGEVYGEYPLNVDQEIDIANGDHYNHITIKNGSCQMSSSTCLNQICVNTAPITKQGKQIVCLPNRVLVEIKSKSGGEVNAVSE